MCLVAAVGADDPLSLAFDLIVEGIQADELRVVAFELVNPTADRFEGLFVLVVFVFRNGPDSRLETIVCIRILFLELGEEFGGGILTVDGERRDFPLRPKVDGGQNDFN